MIEISTFEELQKVGTGEDGYTADADYIQTDNIDCGGASLEGITIAEGGSYHGNRYTIENFVIDSQEDIAFFKENSGTIKRLGLQGEVSGGNYAAGFVLDNAGDIEDCYFRGDVAATEASAGFYLRNDGNIERVYAVTNADFFGFQNNVIVDGYWDYEEHPIQQKESTSLFHCIWEGQEKVYDEYGHYLGPDHQVGSYAFGLSSWISLIGYLEQVEVVVIDEPEGLTDFFYEFRSPYDDPDMYLLEFEIEDFEPWYITQDTEPSDGAAKTTAEMKQVETFSGWDITEVADEDTRNEDHIWNIAPGETYPLLSREAVPFIDIDLVIEGNSDFKLVFEKLTIVEDIAYLTASLEKEVELTASAEHITELIGKINEEADLDGECDKEADLKAALSREVCFKVEMGD